MKNKYTAEIISIGTELLLGEIIDTNSVYLSQQLKNMGIFVYRKSIVGDNRERIKDELAQAFSRSDIVILGGGLGPTDDDLTREAIADFFSKQPYIDDKLLEELKQQFMQFTKTMPDANIKQAWLINNAISLKNPVGTAPGWFVKDNDKYVIAMPGPPHEMKKMWKEVVVKLLPQNETSIHHKTLHTSDIGESTIAEHLSDFTNSSNPSVATYARGNGVDIRIAASCKDKKQSAKLVSDTSILIKKILNDNIYGEDEETLVSQIKKIMDEKHQTLSCMESVTGGTIMSEFTAFAGISSCFKGGIVAYNNEIKNKFGISNSTLNQYGSISKEVASEMALCVKKSFNTDWGLATTGIAGPDTIDNLPIGTAYVAIADPSNKVILRELHRSSTRERIQRYIKISLLFMLYKKLIS